MFKTNLVDNCYDTIIGIGFILLPSADVELGKMYEATGNSWIKGQPC